MLKYTLLIILGIIIYILSNNVNRFSIGVLYETDTKTFYNPDLPIYSHQDIEYIKWANSPDHLRTMEDYLINKIGSRFLLPPIYLGQFKKDAEGDGWNLGLGWRHFFIIDKKIYYFQEITEGDRTFLKPKNYGNRNREPILLIRDDLSASATLVVTERRLFDSYLTITGTDGRNINMYDDILNVQLAKSIIEEYTQLVIRIESIGGQSTGNVVSCSVNIPHSVGRIEGHNLTALLELPSIVAPAYSIDLSTITPVTTLCDSYDSVIKLNLEEVTVSDRSSDILITRLDKSMLPVLEYKGILLIHIDLIFSGSYGRVLRISNKPYSDFNKTSDEGEVAIALILKKYEAIANDWQTGQSDPEIRLIESINEQERLNQDGLNNCLHVGELIGARIITPNPTIEKVAIMDIMDNNMYNMVRDPRYNVYSTLPLEIIKRICIILLCIQTAGYSYTDLKLKNILFKCYRYRKLIITMGDIGSIISSDETDDQLFSNKPPIREEGFNNNNGVVWIFGLVIIELYKLVIWDNDNRREIPDQLKILNPRSLWYNGIYREYASGSQGYFDVVEPAVAYLMGLFDGIKNGTNDIEIDFIKDLLGRIFVRAPERITLEEIHERLSEFNR